MALVSFRPHCLHLIKKGEGSYDSNGDWTESSEEVVARVPCRYEPNGAALTITLDDGTAYRYSYKVYLNVDPGLVIKYGDIIELFSQERKSIGRYEVKGFHRGQLDMKVWI